MDLEKALNAARDAVAEACGLSSRVRGDLDSIRAVVKSDQSPVTVADFGVQALIVSRLRSLFPDVPVVAEEELGELLGADRADEVLGRIVEGVRAIRPDLTATDVRRALERDVPLDAAPPVYWALDPVDGTKGFLRGDQYAVALGLVSSGRPVVGVLGCPGLEYAAGDSGTIFEAASGRGASASRLDQSGRRPIRVSETVSGLEAVLCESVVSDHSAHGLSERVSRRLGMTRPPCRMDSQAKYAVVGRGDCDIYLRLPHSLDYRSKIWDHAAGSIIVTEAGGRVTDMFGRRLDFGVGSTLARNTGIVATNGRLHDRVIDAVKAAWHDPAA
jgi:3'(2'), 5'-bisphosphate nucleotidase